MKDPNTLTFVVLAGVLMSSLALSVHASQMTCAGTFGDGMVLQRDMPLPVWGRALPGQKVTVRLADREATATADADGHWRVTLEPLAAGGPHELTVSGDGMLTFRDVLIGDVWLCSGQSNMEMPFAWTGDAGGDAAKANYPDIRLVTVPKAAVAEPTDDVQCRWSACTPQSVMNFSSVGYFFGRELHKELDVPIGLINSSWGGTPAQSWTRLDVLRGDGRTADLASWYDSAMSALPKATDNYEKAMTAWREAAEQARARGDEPPSQPQPPMGPGNPWLPSSLYNGMIHPLIPFAIKGAIWYQGESNADRSYEYRALFPMMITNWREDWGQGDFPFGFVQLANYMAEQTEPAEGSGWAELREAQLMTLSLSNTGMAVIIDIGDVDDIHPRNKRDVGLRLAMWALARVYGQDIVYSGPIYDAMTVEGDTVRLSFEHVGGGLQAKDGDLRGFAIAGEDKAFHWADARIDGDRVVVRSDAVPEPVAVRYSWANNPIGNLYNAEGLPASPFRTDDWPGVTYEVTPEQLAARWPEPEPVDVPRAAGEPAVDGDPADWDGIALLPMPMLKAASKGVRLAWTERGLYGVVEVTDKEPVSNAQEPWRADSVEVFLDRDFSRGVQRGPTTSWYAFSPAPEIGPGKGHVMAYSGTPEIADAGVECAWQPTATGYTMEFFIPAERLAPAVMEAGTKIGFNLALNVGGRAVEQFYSDKDDMSGWSRPISWGCVRLAD